MRTVLKPQMWSGVEGAGDGGRGRRERERETGPEMREGGTRGRRPHRGGSAVTFLSSLYPPEDRVTSEVDG